jgi:hypothetical protein
MISGTIANAAPLHAFFGRRRALFNKNENIDSPFRRKEAMEHKSPRIRRFSKPAILLRKNYRIGNGVFIKA